MVVVVVDTIRPAKPRGSRHTNSGVHPPLDTWRFDTIRNSRVDEQAVEDVVRVGDVNAQHRLEVVAVRVLLVVVGEAVVAVRVLQVQEQT